MTDRASSRNQDPAEKDRLVQRYGHAPKVEPKERLRGRRTSEGVKVPDTLLRAYNDVATIVEELLPWMEQRGLAAANFALFERLKRDLGDIRRLRGIVSEAEAGQLQNLLRLSERLSRPPDG